MCCVTIAFLAETRNDSDGRLHNFHFELGDGTNIFYERQKEPSYKLVLLVGLVVLLEKEICRDVIGQDDRLRLVL